MHLDSMNVMNSGAERMNSDLNEKQDAVLITREACGNLRISRPTYVRYLCTGRIKGIKAGKGWRVLRSELDRFLIGENG
ncbi:MAG: hypothetical protein A2157_13775 [Deltaproteobacteria bacterium RBG_16_47_11]|nr:MAG: hypothetical protein A2157_13775 [Deltaproteobacteria bacterium RBG_16_47_11]